MKNRILLLTVIIMTLCLLTNTDAQTKKENKKSKTPAAVKVAPEPSPYSSVTVEDLIKSIAAGNQTIQNNIDQLQKQYTMNIGQLNLLSAMNPKDTIKVKIQKQ